MATPPTIEELHARAAGREYIDFVRSAMRDFCFTIDPHTGRDRTWFGSHTITINRNVAFNFFDRDVSSDENLEPFPVIRSDRTESMETRIRPEPDDPSADYVVHVFHLVRGDYDAALRSMDDILERAGGLRTIPDLCFENEFAIRLVREHLLPHPAVKAERAADWPAFLK
jgi:hypothetical protein